MKKFLMALAVTTMAVSPMVAAQAEAAQHRTVDKKVKNTNGKRVVQKTVTQRKGQRVVTKTTIRKNDQRNRYNARDRYNGQRDRYNGQRYSSVSQRHWAKGQRFDRRYATNYRVIDNPRAYRLSNAPRGHQWVRSGNDAVLIAVASGLIGAVIGNAIAR